jgi:hypothetical protein
MKNAAIIFCVNFGVSHPPSVVSHPACRNSGARTKPVTNTPKRAKTRQKTTLPLTTEH